MRPFFLFPLLLTLPLLACNGPAADAPATGTAPSPEPTVTQADASAWAGNAGDAQAATSPLPADSAALPLLTVHKTPTCGCCTLWVEHMQAAGFEVKEVIADDLGPIKQAMGVPYAKGSCHTAEVGGYLVEGHIPADDVKRLLAERPDARGIVLPGMPLGSPGMEVPDGRVQPYTVELVRRDGSVEVFSQHGQ